MDWSVPPPDPKKFNDPFALEVGWDTISGEGSSFRDHQLKQVGPGQMRFVMTGAGIQFCLGFIGLGLAFVGLSIYGLISGKTSLGILMIPGAFFAVLGGVFYRLMNQPVVFDQTSGFFWKGRGQPFQNVIGGAEAPQTVVALNQIHALQLLTRRVLSRTTPGVSGSGSNYLTYELNLVLKDKTRKNVVCHGDIASSRADANALATFLSVPLWDAAKTETECLPPDAPSFIRSIARVVDRKTNDQ